MSAATAPRRRSATSYGLFLLVRRSLAAHALSTAVTVCSLALAAGLVMSVFAVSRQSRDAFTGAPVGFDAVVGARGSKLQLVLNAVFHLETSPGNIPWSVYTIIRDDPRTTLAVPYAVGDNYKGFRIVGTTPELFTKTDPRHGAKWKVVAPGRIFDASHKEAIVGAFAAARSGLTLGSTFKPTHGISSNDPNAHEHDDVYTVVGILEPTGSPSDRVVWIPIEGIFRMSGHVLRGTGTEYKASAGEAIPDEAKEVSAVMVKLKTPQFGLSMAQKINTQGKIATMAYPLASVMADLFDKIGWVVRVLEMVAYLTVAVGAGAVLASLYNTLEERRREFAILRALGAGRGTIFAAILMESAAISALGAAVGFFVYAVVLGVASYVVRVQTGVILDVFSAHPVFFWAPLGMICVGVLAGLLPAAKAYRTDVASNLVPAS